MNNNTTENYALLSQDEIDVLVSFLTEKKDAMDNTIMSQDSIDKLIYLITKDDEKFINYIDPLSRIDSNYLINARFRNSNDDNCELCFEKFESTGYLHIFAYNPETEKTFDITPALFNADDTEDWGICVTPSEFNRIARALSLKYTTATHDSICSNFAKSYYGDETHPIPALHLPTNSNLLDSLI